MRPRPLQQVLKPPVDGFRASIANPPATADFRDPLILRHEILVVRLSPASAKAVRGYAFEHDMTVQDLLLEVLSWHAIGYT